jgi:glyoxylase-like metal-dependent hydrolase (beta-lactamase superfamily II)
MKYHHHNKASEVETRLQMQITAHIYSTHILEDPNTFGAHHPGGTQIYFVGDPTDHMVVIDSGEPYRSWTHQILDYHAELGRPLISAILITHGHGDHIGGLERLQDAWGCQVRCHPKLEPRLTQRLGPGWVVKLRSREVIPTDGGITLRALFTPGHEDDHVAYYSPADRVLFSGDTILGNSSTSVRNLKQYMASLELMARQRPSIICPGHGQVIHDGLARIQWYLQHRQERENQVLVALKGGARSVDEIVQAIYPRNLRKGLRESAARNVLTHLEKLSQEGRVVEHSAAYSLKNS